MPNKIVWGLLKERTVDQYVADASMDVAATCAAAGYIRLSIPYMRTDDARNLAVDAFLQVSEQPTDTLVMLDCDHLHPPYIVGALAAHPQGVVGALAFRRSESSDPLFFMLTDGQLRAPAEWEPGTLYSCDFVGTGAIAIKRAVFDQLAAEGEQAPFFRITYQDGEPKAVGEDRYFAELCMKHGLKHHCATALEIPHLSQRLSTSESWTDWKEKNRERVINSTYKPNVPRGEGSTLLRIATRVKER